MRVGIVGEDLAGLACGHYLARRGLEPIWLGPGEPSRRPAGLPLGLDPVDRPIRATDSALCSLLGELGLLCDVTWHDVGDGLRLAGRLQPVPTPRALLRSMDLPYLTRWRVAAGLLRTTEWMHYARPLDEQPALEWLTRSFGRHAVRVFFGPYLEHRFGEHAADVPAAWVWAFLRGLRAGRVQRRGYLPGGMARVARRIRAEVGPAPLLRGARPPGAPLFVEADGGGVRVGTADGPLELDALIWARPGFELAKLAHGAWASALSPVERPARARLTAAVVCRGEVSPFHRCLVLERDARFVEVCDATRALGDALPRDTSLLYLSRSCDPSSVAFALPEARLREQVLDTLGRIVPGFDPARLESIRITRERDAEPVPRIGELASDPGLRVARAPVWLCTPESTYPRAPGWDAAVMRAREVCASLLRSIGASLHPDG